MENASDLYDSAMRVGQAPTRLYVEGALQEVGFWSGRGSRGGRIQVSGCAHS